MELIEWCEHYARSRDAFERKIVSMQRVSAGLLVTRKDGEVAYAVSEALDPAVASREGAVVAVCGQSRENFETLVNHFAAFAKKQDLTVIFVNARENEKWIVKPALHAQVADTETLRSGLQAMYDMVPEP